MMKEGAALFGGEVPVWLDGLNEEPGDRDL